MTSSRAATLLAGLVTVMVIPACSPAGQAEASASPSVSAAAATPSGSTPTVTAIPPPAAPAGVAMPNPAWTPGEAFPGVTTAQVCTSGYSSSVRNVTTAQYHEVYAEYGVPYPEPSGSYELDHLIPLELGGDNANANLWPSPANPTPGFHQKDNLENRLHDLVCSGQLDLHASQQAIATNWWTAYQRYVGG